MRLSFFMFITAVCFLFLCQYNCSMQNGPFFFFSRFSDEHQEGVEAIGETSAAGKSGAPASRMSEKRVAPVLQASTTGPLHLPVKP